MCSIIPSRITYTCIVACAIRVLYSRAVRTWIWKICCHVFDRCSQWCSVEPNSGTIITAKRISTLLHRHYKSLWWQKFDFCVHYRMDSCWMINECWSSTRFTGVCGRLSSVSVRQIWQPAKRDYSSYYLSVNYKDFHILCVPCWLILLNCVLCTMQMSFGYKTQIKRNGRNNRSCLRCIAAHTTHAKALELHLFRCVCNSGHSRFDSFCVWTRCFLHSFGFAAVAYSPITHNHIHIYLSIWIYAAARISDPHQLSKW